MGGSAERVGPKVIVRKQTGGKDAAWFVRNWDMPVIVGSTGSDLKQFDMGEAQYWSEAEAEPDFVAGPPQPSLDVEPPNVTTAKEGDLGSLTGLAGALGLPLDQLSKLDAALLSRGDGGVRDRLKRIVQSELGAVLLGNASDHSVKKDKLPLRDPSRGRTAEVNREKVAMKLSVDPLAWQRLSEIADLRRADIGEIVSQLIVASPDQLKVLEVGKSPKRIQSGPRAKKAVRVPAYVQEIAKIRADNEGFSTRGAWVSRLVETYVRTKVAEAMH